MNAILGYDATVIDHIVRFADANNLPPVCLLALGLQESNLDTQAVGDITIGGSVGVFQIYLQAHGGPPERWTGIDGLDNSMTEMRDRWQREFATAGGWDAVLHDIIAFQVEWAPAAQGSIAWTDSMARQRISTAIALYALCLKQQIPAAPATDAINGLTLAAAGLDDLALRADTIAGTVANLRERAKLQAKGIRDALARIGS